MSRFRPQVGPSISLFPFLAVLLCTMGALLVLLVLFSSSADRADANAAAVAAAEAAAKAAQALQEELEGTRDEMAWRIDQLADVRTRTMDDLARARMQLAGIEADARSLVDELDALERTAAALEDTTDEEPGSLDDLEQRLAEAKARAQEARSEAAERPPAYAVMPYDGDSGTRRRPLYIECCLDGVFLQPEGIRLGPADFEGPPGPGNPLASALRAAREYLASHSGESAEPSAQPYPLLLVRPSGVMAYYAARESLQSWGSEFGYQFIDEDWTLTFPPADPALAAEETRAIEEARRRLEWLAQVRPPKRTKPAVQYRASTTRGGVVAAGGPSVLGDQSRWDWTEEQARAASGPGRGFRAGGDGQGRGDPVVGNGQGQGQGNGQGGDAADGGDPTAGGPRGAESNFVGPSKFYGGPGDQPGGPGAAGAAAGGGTENSLSAAQGGGAQGGGDSQGTADGQGSAYAQGSARAQGAAHDASAAGDGQSADGGESGPAGSGSSTASTQQAASGASAGGGGASGQSMPGMPQSASASQGGPSAADSCSDGACSMAGRRGSNWASLASQDRQIPLTRPIRLECSGDEFRVLGDGGRVVARVPIGSNTADSVDPLVRHVHTTVGSWGMAGDRMYWRPELVLTATPDGTGRLTDLEQLLADSGLDTRRASAPREAVRPLPPVHRAGALRSPY
jgi:hypothetical protein